LRRQLSIDIAAASQVQGKSINQWVSEVLEKAAHI
jgi:predicted HicB family RNase H-like nuclease